VGGFFFDFEAIPRPRCSAQVFAYIWLLIILMVSSPNVVEVWEAVLTFLFFPILTGLAFAADKGWLDKCASKVAPTESRVTAIGGMHFHSYDFRELMAKLRHPHTTHEERQDIIAKLSKTTKKAKPSRAVQRMNATRSAIGKKAIQQNAPDPKALEKYLAKISGGKKHGPRAFFSDAKGKINTKYALLESDGSVTLNVTRTPPTGTMKVKWSTRDGTAKGSDPGASKKGDFEKSSGELVFTDGENFQSITVTVYDDVETEVDEARSRRPVTRGRGWFLLRF
jgi:solute carrier family 8 (sodium/calcium exchanger)